MAGRGVTQETSEHSYQVDQFRIPLQVGRFRRPEREKSV